jgi:hypothetical protein
MILILAVAVMTVFTVDAKDHGKSQADAHSNSQASANRHKGKHRAEVVGRGKKKGVKKHKGHAFWHRNGRH